jgi:nitroimidazol reductase NimA-like FMN-containing flavoprotein (pyridoxamine 5'-phosphate oxidase superfamily)
MNLTERTKLRRLPARGSHELEAIDKILDAAFLAHIGFCVDGQPFVIPTNFGREDDKLYLHGSAASRMLKELSTGVPACLTVTHVDGLVLARSAFHHSMNYRSVVAFGTAKRIDDAEKKMHALQVISEHLIRGRWDEVREPNEKEMKQTSVLEFVIEEASAKMRTGGPIDDEEDYALPVWAGVLPLRLSPGKVIPDERLAADLDVPNYVAQYKSE